MAAASAAAVAPRGNRRPNFFVGFRIANPAIIANVAELQQRIATQFPEVAQCSIDIRTLHVTLCTLHLTTEQEIEEAVRITGAYSHKNGLPPFGDEVPEYDFRGVDFFGKNFILYAPLDTSSRFADTLAELAETMHNAFEAAGLAAGVFKKPYTPHITLWKTTKFMKYIKQLNKRRSRPIEHALGDYLDQSEPVYFGNENPTSIELLSLREKEADGYYKVYRSVNLVLTEPSDDEEKVALMEKLEIASPDAP